MAIWDAFHRPNPEEASSTRPPGPARGLLDWARWAIGWPGAKRAEGTAAELYLTQERARAGPPGIVFPWFLPYYDEGQTVGESATMRLAYRRMLNDPNVKAALFGKIQAVSNLTLKIIPQDRKDQKQAQIADLVRWNLEEALDGGMPDLAWNILTGGLIDGFSVCEKVFAREEKGKYAGSYYLRALKPKDATRDVILLTDEFRNVVGVQGLRYNPGVTFSPAKFVIYRHQPLFDNPTGMSDLRATYKSWWMLDTVQKLRAVGLEKRSLPVVVGEYQTAQQRPAVEEALSLVKSQSWLAVPEGVKVQALNIAGGADSQFDSAIRQLSEEIFLGIAGATLQARQGDVNNARGSSQVHRNTADLFIDYLRVKLQQILNDRSNGLVRDIVDLNCVTDDYPRATLAAVDEADMKAQLEIVKGLWEVGVKQSLNAIYDKFGCEPPDASDDSDSLGGKADQEAQVAAATIAAPQGPGMAAADDRVLTDDTLANAGTQSMTGPMGAMGGATEGDPAQQMAEGDGEGPEHEPGDSVRASNHMQSKGKPPHEEADSDIGYQDRRAIYSRGRGNRARVVLDQSGVPEGHTRILNATASRPMIVPNQHLQHDATPDAPDDMAEIRGGWNDGEGIDAPVHSGAGVDTLGRVYYMAAGKHVSGKRPLPPRRPRRMAEKDQQPGELTRDKPFVPEPPLPPQDGTRPDPEQYEDDPRGTRQRQAVTGAPLEQQRPDHRPLAGGTGRVGKAPQDATPRQHDAAARQAELYEVATLPRASARHVEDLSHEDLSTARYIAPERPGRTLHASLIGDVIAGGRVHFYKGVSGAAARREEAASRLLRYAGTHAPVVRRARVSGAPEEVPGEGGLVMEHAGDETLTHLYDRVENLYVPATRAHQKRVREREVIGELGREMRQRLRPGEIDRAVLSGLLLGVNDRHMGNYMVRGDRLVSIDHEFGFWNGIVPQRTFGPLDGQNVTQNSLAHFLPDARGGDRSLSPEVVRDMAGRASSLADAAEEAEPGSGRWVRLHGRALAALARERQPTVGMLVEILAAMRQDVTGTDLPMSFWWRREGAPENQQGQGAAKMAEGDSRRMDVFFRSEHAASIELTPSGKLRLSGERAGAVRQIVAHYASSGLRGGELFDALLASLRGHWNAHEVGGETEDMTEGDTPMSGGSQDAVNLFTQPVQGAKRRRFAENDSGPRDYRKEQVERQAKAYQKEADSLSPSLTADGESPYNRGGNPQPPKDSPMAINPPAKQPAQSPPPPTPVDVVKHVTPEMQPLLHAAAFGYEDDTEYDAHALADWLEEIGAGEDSAAVRVRPERSIYLARHYLIGPLGRSDVEEDRSEEPVEVANFSNYDEEGFHYPITVRVQMGWVQLDDGTNVEAYRWQTRDDDSGMRLDNGDWVFDPEEAAEAGRQIAQDNDEDEPDDMEFIDGEEG